MLNKYAVHALNGLLGVLACFLLATLVTALVPEPAVEPAGLARAPVAAPRPKGWDDRKVILERNLFNASVLAPKVPEESLEDLEATKLPLKLLGTVAGGSDQSWAAVLDTETGQHVVVRVDDVLKERAKVLRIERRRIVLQNGARREELALEGDEGGVTERVARATPTAGRGIRARRNAAGNADLESRIRQLAENRFSVNREDVAEAARNPANLFSQARILPRYEAGAMVGVQVNAIQPGSLLEEIGLQNGDTISEVNGVRISSPEDSTSVLRELSEATQFTVVVTGNDGQQRTLTYQLEE
jgi:general secretion pathway protein C